MPMLRQDTMPLVEAAKAGDRAAFSQLVQFHYSMVNGVTFSTVKNSAAAEHVGLGLDFVFDGVELDDYLEKFKDTFPEGMGYDAGIKMVSPEQHPEITEGLLGLGYAEDTIRGILGENFLRVAKAVWK